jgi:16S rRNA (uracil1498-N3)-methyltransferase
MPLRFHVDPPLHEGADLSLPPGAARHAQVLRLQPGMAITLFDGSGGEWSASILRMGRSEVSVRVGAHLAVDRELALHVTLAVGMPANERMDTLVEKATELGVARIQPLHAERSVLRLSGDRAERKRAHWQAVAQAACEQCGRAVLPVVEPVLDLPAWLAQLPADAPGLHRSRWLLSLAGGALPPAALPAPTGGLLTLSGPEGGLTPDEEAAARHAGFQPVALGPRVLRADTAPLAVLAWLALS